MSENRVGREEENRRSRAKNESVEKLEKKEQEEKGLAGSHARSDKLVGICSAEPLQDPHPQKGMYTGCLSSLWPPTWVH